MKILFFDTETTWLPTGWSLESEPHIVQFGAVLGEYDDEWYIIAEEIIDKIFNPWINIPANLTAIHWISNEMAQKEPKMQDTDFLKWLVQITKEVDFIVGHNIEFDTKLVFFEIDRKYKSNSEEKIAWKKMFLEKSLCTMKNSVNFCKLPWSRYWFKNPKLIELHTKLFGEGFDNAHNAVADIEATRNCFFEMKKLWLFTF